MKPLTLFAALLCTSTLVWGQAASLQGLVTDQSGAIVPAAIITVVSKAGLASTSQTGQNGVYSFPDLAPGPYTVDASAPSLYLKQPVNLPLHAGHQTLNLTLYVVVASQQITVEENASVLSTDSSTNASAVSITGKDLDALSDNPDELQADLQALAGPAAGPNGGSIYVDGFSGGDLPPKNAIREVRINQNPFSSEYDRLGYGRIEIFTKPGSDKFRVSLGYNFANDAWNSRNPYSAQKAPFSLNESRNTLSGPLGKRSSFTLDGNREWVDNGAVMNGITLDPSTLAAVAFNNATLASLRRSVVSPRFDTQLAAKHTLSTRFSYRHDDVQNAGLGGLNLASTGFHSTSSIQTLQVTETAVLGDTAVNETRFQYTRPVTASTANTVGYQLRVLGSFVGGGSTVGGSSDTQNSLELQNYTSILHRSHTVKFGLRLRATTETSVARQNFNGIFTFSGGLAPQLDANNQPILNAAGQPIQADISSIESYRRTLFFQKLGTSPSLIRQLGGGASQFSLNAGTPSIDDKQIDLGFFVGDDWKARPNLTLAFGLRYEMQTNLHDARDLAPRIGLAWAPGSKGKSASKTVLRAGFGIFYDRFALANTLAAMRANGLLQQQFVVADPEFFPNLPAVSSLGGAAASTTQRLDSALRAPYLMQSALAVERQLPHNTTLAITYANTHGLHQLRSEDINAPLPGSYNPLTPASANYPLGTTGQVLVMRTAGLYNQNQIIANVNAKIAKNLSFTTSYIYNRALSNTDGLSTLSATPYSMAGEYGPAASDIHHYFSLTGTIVPRWGITLNPMFTANSGPPFDITIGRDLWGDGQLNARPGIATDATRTGVVATRYGLLDPNPMASERLVSRNYGRGPGQLLLNLRVGRTFGFGTPRAEGGSDLSVPVQGNGGGGGGNRGGGGGNPFSMGANSAGIAASRPHRYYLTVAMSMRNLINHNNPGPITGNITSPLFGLANQPSDAGNGIFTESANNRRLELQTRLNF